MKKFVSVALAIVATLSLSTAAMATDWISFKKLDDKTNRSYICISTKSTELNEAIGRILELAAARRGTQIAAIAGGDKKDSDCGGHFEIRDSGDQRRYLVLTKKETGSHRFLVTAADIDMHVFGTKDL